ncbi:tetratricopeptide repeat protein [Streptomyces yokosukanensis]|uniref:tetratricopeptide repeat protein n=1 Tax=Streptomyces yokosukanensis TaxID=67386 RepID=UPI003415AAE6
MSVHWERPPWLVSVRRTEHADPVGVGLLVTPRHVLTCAHLVQPGRATAVPDKPVFVRFQYASPHDPIPATVVPDGWHPVTGDDTGDVAVLELGAPLPPEAVPAPLRTTDPGTWDHRFRAYGYPTEHRRQGVPVRGDIIGHAGPEWLQVEAAAHTGWGLEKGFSGSPVWDVDSQGVIGMLVARDPVSSVDRRTAYAVKVEALVRYWPQLAGHVKDATTTEVRHRLESLLWVPLTEDCEIPRVDQVDPHDIGVAGSKYSGSPAAGRAHRAAAGAPYVPRSPQDGRLDELLVSRRLVLLAGRSKAGKSRTLYEGLVRTMPHARLVVPRPDGPGRGSLEALSRLRLPTGSDPVVLWLDDLHRYLQPGGLDLQILDRLARRHPAVTVVATIPAKQRAALTGMDNDIGRVARTVLNKAATVELPSLLAPGDVTAAQELYPGEDFTTRGIGELMVAAPALEQRFTDGVESCPAGWVLARAAADRLRIGLTEPVPESVLRELFASYLSAHHPEADADEDAYRTGLAWAREPVAGSIALLQRVRAPDGTTGYAGTPYMAEYLDTRDDDPSAAVPGFAWEYLMGHGTPSALLPTAYTALVRGESEVAERMLRRVADGSGDPDGSAWALLVLGELHHDRAEFDAAAELLERAAASAVDGVVPLAQVALADILVMNGDLVRSRRLLESVVGSPDPQISQLAQVGLSVLLYAEGEDERAERLLEAAVAAGDEEVARKAHVRLVNALTGSDGEAAGVSTAPATADRARARVGVGTGRGRPAEPAEQPWALSRAMGESMADEVAAVARVSLGDLLTRQGKLDRAEEVLRSLLAGSEVHAVRPAQTSLAELLLVRGQFDEAEQILRELIGYGNPALVPYAKILLAIAVRARGGLEQGMVLLREAADSGHPHYGPRAACGLGEWYAGQGDTPAAEEWFGRAIGGGHPGWSGLARIEFAVVLALQEGDMDRATGLLAAVIDSGDPRMVAYAADVLGNLLVRHERTDEAERAYRVAVDSGHRHWAPAARVDLAVLLATRNGDTATATDLLHTVIESGHPHLRPRAADCLGDLLARGGRFDEAERAYRIAIDSAHPQWSLIARMDLALLLAAAGDFAGAERLLREVAGSGDGTAEPWARAVLGVVLVHAGQREEGKGQLRAASEAEAGAASQFGRFQLAKCLLEEGASEQAESLLRTLTEGEPSQVTEVARAYLAVLLLHGDPEAAMELLGRASGSDDEAAAAPACLAAGELLLELGEVRAAGELLQAVVEVTEPHELPRARALLGVVRRSVNDLDGARRLLTEALAAGDPAVEPLARRYLGSTLFRMGLPAEAEQALSPLVRSQDAEHWPEALLLLGRVLASDDRPEEAYPWLRQAIECGDGEIAAEAREVYAELLLSDGRRERQAEEPSRGAPPAPPPRRSPHAAPSAFPPPPLPAAVHSLLGDVADAEGKEEEAAFWYALARRTGGIR